MQSALILLLILPGYLFLRFSESDSTLKKEENWQLILRLGTASILFFLIARITYIVVFSLFRCVNDKLNIDVVSLARDFWHLLLPLEYSFTLAVACFWAWLLKDNKKVKILLFGNPEVDVYFRTLSELINPEVNSLIETKSGKVYMGEITQATLIAANKDDERVIVISPYFSGHRDQNKILAVTTIYIPNNNNQRGEKPLLEITIPFREIISYRRFDDSFFMECARAGKVNFVDINSAQNVSEKT